MNEDERGITPPDVTAMSIEAVGDSWMVIIEQGNGDLVKTIELTDMERLQLLLVLDFDPSGDPSVHDVSFVDFDRSADDQEAVTDGS